MLTKNPAPMHLGPLPEAAFVEITPEAAAELLLRNPKNRNYRAHHAAKMARDMKAGRFQMNGEPILIDRDGNVLDGQHRLHACVDSGIPLRTLLVTGLPPEVRETIDSGAARTIGDRFTMEGVPNAHTVAAAARLITGLANGRGYAASVTPSEAARILELHPGLVDSASKSHTAMPKMGSVLTAFHYVGTVVEDVSMADAFLGVFKTGVPFYREGDPAHLLRERILRDRGGHHAVMAADLLPLLITAWKHFRAATPVKKLVPANEIAIEGWTTRELGLEPSRQEPARDAKSETKSKTNRATRRPSGRTQVALI